MSQKSSDYWSIQLTNPFSYSDGSEYEDCASILNKWKSFEKTHDSCISLAHCIEIALVVTYLLSISCNFYLW